MLTIKPFPTRSQEAKILEGQKYQPLQDRTSSIDILIQEEMKDCMTIYGHNFLA